MLYNRHGVAEIAEARADVGNLGRTTDAIRHARRGGPCRLAPRDPVRHRHTGRRQDTVRLERGVPRDDAVPRS